jgi:hypothetical protein
VLRELGLNTSQAVCILDRQGSLTVILSSLLNCLMAVEAYVTSPAYFGRFSRGRFSDRVQPIVVANGRHQPCCVRIMHPLHSQCLARILSVEDSHHGHRGRTG